VTLHHHTTNYGQAQLGHLGLQKDELLKLVPALHHSILPSPVDVGHLVGQALEVDLGRILGLAHINDLTIQKATF
jgi:hypothetical protein